MSICIKDQIQNMNLVIGALLDVRTAMPETIRGVITS